MVKEELYISYISQEIYITGTSTSDTDFKLIDSGALFLTGTTNISSGDRVTNTSTELFARVISVDSNIQLTLNVNIFPSGSSPIGYKVNKKVRSTVELLKSLNPNLTFSISDIANPDKRKSDFSKTIKLPASKIINKIFEHSFEVNLALQSFNPNLKTGVQYLVDGEVNLDGYLQLKQINVIDKDDITYDVTMTGRIGDFITELSNSLLTDLDFTSMNHIYNVTNQAATWVTPANINVLGYVYPMINYDIQYAQTGNTEIWNVGQFYPAITVKKYIDEIFDSVDYTYSSDFFDTDYFGSLIVPFSALDNKLTMAEINNVNFRADTPQFYDTTTLRNVGMYINSSGSANDVIMCINDSTPPAHDAGNNYSASLPTVGSNYIAPRNGYYNFECSMVLEGKFVAPAASPTAVGNDGKWYLQHGILGAIEIIRYDPASFITDSLEGAQRFGIYSPDHAPPSKGGTIGTLPSGVITTTVSPTTPSDEYFIGGTSGGLITINAQNTNTECNRFTAHVTNLWLNSGDRVFLKYGSGGSSTGGGSTGYQYMADYTVLTNAPTAGFNEINWIDSTETENAIGNNTMTALRFREGYFLGGLVNNAVADGDTLGMNSTVPEKIKQKDFFMSIVKMFNLYIQTDTANDHNLLIEPRDDFYLDGSANIIDWSKKLDLSQPLETLPMGSLDSIDYLYTYKDDKDYYNELYNSTWGKIYGEKLYDEYENDFLKKQHKTEIIFSPTPSVGQLHYDRVLPTIFKYDSQNGVQRTQSNIRILQYGGMKATGQSWSHEGVGVSGTTMNTYPYAGMYDDPYTPTEDIGFGLTREIYWNQIFGNIITFTNNNLFNKYHRKFIEEITDKDSKIIKGWFYLTSSDIRALSFRKLYWFENAYFRLNKIENYNPQNPVTKCEFLKIKLADVFSASTLATSGGLANIVNEPAPYYGNSTGTIGGGNSVATKNVNVLGVNNSVSRSATGVMVVGDGNTILGMAKNVIIQGSYNWVGSGVENVSLLNTNNVSVDESNVSYIDGQKKGSIETITATQDADESVEVYLCDTSGGGFNVQLPKPTLVGQTWTIKSIDATNTVSIRASPYLIDGAGTQTLTTLYETKTVMWDGTTFHIISEF